VKILSVALASGADMEAALAAIGRARPGALILLPTATPVASAAAERRADEVIQ
jgi:hypothetical protein